MGVVAQISIIRMVSKTTTTMDKDYKNALASPQWQKKRLEIMQRDNFACRYCGNQERTLHIHHKSYEKGKKPWEYDNKNMITLCDKCHEYITDEKNSLYENFIFARNSIREFGFSDAILNAIFVHIVSFFEGLKVGEDDDKIATIIDDAVMCTQNYDDIKMLACLGIKHDDFVRSQYPMFLDDYCSTTRK